MYMHAARSWWPKGACESNGSHSRSASTSPMRPSTSTWYHPAPFEPEPKIDLEPQSKVVFETQSKSFLNLYKKSMFCDIIIFWRILPMNARKMAP